MVENRLQIKPLIKYEVFLRNFDSDMNDAADVFTAESYEVIDGRTIFYRTGNKIREYQRTVDRIVATPDEG